MDEVFTVPYFEINYPALSVMPKTCKMLYLFLHAQRGKRLSVDAISMVLGVTPKTLYKAMQIVVNEHNKGV